MIDGFVRLRNDAARALNFLLISRFPAFATMHSIDFVSCGDFMKTVDLALPLCRERPLTLSEVESGIDKLQETAIRLLKDARLLLNARRHATAATLAAMAIAEMGRGAALLDLATAKTEQSVKAAWQRFREPDGHLPWSLLDPAISEKLEGWINNLVGLLRTAGSRTECIEPGAWVSGDKLIRRDLAAELIATAESLCRRKPNAQVLRIWVDVANSQPQNIPPEQTLAAYADALAHAGLPGETLRAYGDLRDHFADAT